MANPYLELKRLMGRGRLQTVGVVIEVLRNNAYRIRTASGSLDVVASGSEVYQLNDELLVANGIIQGRVNPSGSIPVYEV